VSEEHGTDVSRAAGAEEPGSFVDPPGAGTQSHLMLAATDSQQIPTGKRERVEPALSTV
jgi:hypothetical protein